MGRKNCHMNEKRLAKMVILWRDSEWWQDQLKGASAYGARPLRARPGNILRWEDDFRKFANTQNWQILQTKANTEEWSAFWEKIVEWAWR